MMDRITETAQWLKEQYAHPIDTIVILGSGLGDFADQFQKRDLVPYKDIPNFPESTVEGHAGQLVFTALENGRHLACMQGRFHFYEGYSMGDVVFPVRVLKQLGAKTLIVTNAAGGINPGFKPGDLMLITDHLNEMGDNPQVGKNIDELGPRFPDMSDAYSKALRQLVLEAASGAGVELQQGVYAGMRGGLYETPAEIKKLSILGADAVGMSTVPEVIAANHMSMQVIGISCITNFAAGILDQPLDHQEVIETGQQAKERFCRLLEAILNRLPVEDKALT